MSSLPPSRVVATLTGFRDHPLFLKVAISPGFLIFTGGSSQMTLRGKLPPMSFLTARIASFSVPWTIPRSAGPGYVAVCSACVAIDDALLRVVDLSKDSVFTVHAFFYKSKGRNGGREKRRTRHQYPEGSGGPGGGTRLPRHRDVPSAAIVHPPPRRSNFSGYFRKCPPEHRVDRTWYVRSHVPPRRCLGRSTGSPLSNAR